MSDDLAYQTVSRALDHSPQPRSGMRAFMEMRDPSGVPHDDGDGGAP
jgi:hypothetical protein